MGRSDIVTLLPIDRYSEIQGINGSHFNQLNGVKAPTGACNDLWDQDARDALAWTMKQAEDLIIKELGFYPVPTFVTDEEQEFNLPGVRSDWRNAELATDWKYVTCFGTETLTLLQANATVEYLDLDADPLEREEWGEIGGLVYQDLPACADPCSVRVFFRVADGAEDAADPRWEIRPLKVDIDGPTMRIRARSELFVRPILWDLTQADCAGGGTTGDVNKWKWQFELANLVSQVDVYCMSVNQATPVTLYWDSQAVGCETCLGVCQHKTQTACAYVTDKKQGFFIPRPATWNGTTNITATPTVYTPPEYVKINYRAGYPLDRNCRMDANLERAIVKLTNALLQEPPCGYCDAAETAWKHDRTAIDPLTPEAASMPWDVYTIGALEAWRIVKKYAHGRGGKSGR